MFELFVFLVGVLVGCFLTVIWLSARARWTKARAMLNAPDKVRAEGRDRIKQARGQATKARYELLRVGFIFFLLLLALSGVVIVAAMALL